MPAYPVTTSPLLLHPHAGRLTQLTSALAAVLQNPRFTAGLDAGLSVREERGRALLGSRFQLDISLWSRRRLELAAGGDAARSTRLTGAGGHGLYVCGQ